MIRWWNNVIVAASVWCNAVIGGKRYEMFSSRCWRRAVMDNNTNLFWCLPMALLDMLFGTNHCRNCYFFERDHFDGIQD